MTKRTNERQLISLALRCNTTRQIAGIFLNRGNASLKEIYHILNQSLRTPQFSKSAIRGALYRWRKKAILLTDGHRYFINPRGGRQVFITALGGEEESVRNELALVQVTSPSERKTDLLVMTRRDWDEALDIPAAWEENNRIYCAVNRHISQALWELCEKKPKKKKKGHGDRASKAVHKEHDFTLIAFPSGKFHVLTKKSAGWMEKLCTWLVKGEFGKSDLVLVRKAIYASYGESIGTVEVPIVKALETVKQFRIDMELGKLKASLQLVHSHFEDGEIEATGTKRFRDEWLASLAGATLAGIGREESLDEIREQNDELKEELSRLEVMFEALRESVKKKESGQMMKMLEELAKKIEQVDSKIQGMDIPKIEPIEGKEPDYYV